MRLRHLVNRSTTKAENRVSTTTKHSNDSLSTKTPGVEIWLTQMSSKNLVTFNPRLDQEPRILSHRSRNQTRRDRLLMTGLKKWNCGKATTLCSTRPIWARSSPCWSAISSTSDSTSLLLGSRSKFNQLSRTLADSLKWWIQCTFLSTRLCLCLSCHRVL